MPSKTYGIMAAGRPVLFIGPQESTVARVIERFRCGWQFDCGDVQGVVELLRMLAQVPELIDEYGRRAREAFEQHHDLPLGVGRICQIIGARTEVLLP